MTEIVIPLPLRVHTDGQSRVTVAGRTVGEALAGLIARFPNLEAELLTPDGAVRPALHLFLGEREINSLQGLATPLPPGERLILVLPISGG
jgi:molybdopterin converting factor small subunit